MDYDQFLLEISRDNTIAMEYLALNTKREKKDPLPLGVSELECDFITSFINRLYTNTLNADDLRLLGKALYKAIFPGEINTRFEQVCKAVSDEYYAGNRGRRLRVHITVDEGSKVAAWPLEFLCDDNDTWLATAQFITLSRSQKSRLDYEPPVTHPLPLNVLVVISSPRGMGGVLSAKVVEEILKLGREESYPTEEFHSPRLSSLASRRAKPSEPQVKVTVLGQVDEKVPGATYLDKPATFAHLRQVLEEKESALPDVLHFIGHGQIDSKNKGQLVFVKNDGGPDPVYGDDLGNLFPSPNRMLRLVVLQACQSAATSTGTGFMSVAAQLFKRNIPGVVAMQFDIDNAYATLFAADFYESLAQGHEVDAAVQRGRVKITNEETRWSVRHFGTPVLFMLNPYGIIVPVGIVPPAEPRYTTPPPQRPESAPRSQQIQEAIDQLKERAKRFLDEGKFDEAQESIRFAEKLEKETTTSRVSTASPVFQTDPRLASLDSSSKS